MPDQLPLLPLVLGLVPDGLRRALAQAGVPCRDQHSAPTEGRFVLFDSRGAQNLVIADGQIAIDVDRLRASFDEDPFSALENELSCRCEWQIGRLRVQESVARVDKFRIRKRLLADLRAMVEGAGGTWLQVSAYPFPYRSVFNFRIDHDDYDDHDFAATLDATIGHEAAISHYVCAADFVGRRDELARLRGQHIGSHGFLHHTFRDAADNRRNIRRGIEALRNEGVEPVGFAAPHGRFNRALRAALSELGVGHSSEFGLAYDELPFFLGDVLQIPIHPICLGVCMEAALERGAGFQPAIPGFYGRLETCPTSPAAAAEITLTHFQEFAREASLAGEPILLYGHPTGRLGRYPHVLAGILQSVARLHGVWRTTLAEWAAWWRARAGAKLSVVQESYRWTVHAEGLGTSYPMAAEVWRGETVATLPLDQPITTFTPSALAFERRPFNRSRPAPKPVPNEGWRERMRTYLDWERVTPIEEIGADTLRHWAKRTLRRIKD
ncbi:MAG TPA: hypothetical protein VND64_34075 [Pirellulales bacterium]|nr:hypothetical protein [Pirellulales bacterium]